MKRYICIDDIGQDMEAMLKLLREHGYSVSESSGDQAYLTNPTFCPTDSPGIRSVKEAATFGDAASGDAPRLEAPFQRVFRASPDATLVTRVDDGFVLDSNESFMELTGYGRDEMLGQNILNLVFFLNPEFWTQVFLRLEAEGEVQDLETRIWRKDGLVAFVLVSLRRVEINGIPCHVITLRDKVPSTSRGTMDLQWSVPDGGLESLLSEDVDVNRDDVGRLIDFQALQDLMNSFYKITRIGIGINDIKGNVQVATGWQDVCTRFFRIHPEALKNCLESDIYLSGKLGQGEALYKCKHGMWELATPLVIGGRHIANIFLGQFFFEDEVPDYDFFRKQAQAYGFDSEEFLAALDRVPRWSRELVQNVMEFYKKLAVMISRLSIGTIHFSQALARQKCISEELRQANLVMENSPVVVFRWRAEEGWPVELVSSNVTRFGYAREELLSGSVPFSSLVHPDDLQRVVSEVGGYTAAGNDSFQQEYRIVTKEGEVRWIDDRTVIERDAEGRVTHYQGIVMDITERRRAEEAIHQSEEKFRTLFMSLNEGFYLSELIYDDDGNPCDYRFLEANPKFGQIMGIGRDQIIGKRYKELVPVDTTQWLDNYFHVALTGEPCTYEFYSNEYRMHFETYAYQPAKGQVSVLVIDTTERRLVEERLRLIQYCVDKATVNIFLITPGEGKIIYTNEHMCRNLGYSSEELSSMTTLDLDPFLTREMIEEMTTKLYVSGNNPTFEAFHRRKDGTIFPVEVSVSQVNFEGKELALCFSQDIAERKRAEEAIRESEDRLQSIFRVAPIGIGVVRDRALLEVNTRLCEMTGYRQEELVGESARILYPDREEFERVGRDKYRQIGEKGTGSIETRWRRRDGAIIDILLASTPMDPSDLSKGVTFTALDITERKRTEEALRESEEKFRVLAETSPAGIILYQGERIVYANCAASRIFGYSVDELLEMVFWERVHEDFVETVRERGRARLRGEDVPNQYECKFVSKDGEAFWAIISVGCMEYKGKLAGIVTLIEITEMKRSEQRLQVSLAEKTIMLKEIHHRVKNNLQIISSLLDLQSDSIPDEDSRRSFSESQNRIRSMALVHEKLYQTESFSSISFGDYIDNLTQYLFSTLAKDPDQILFTIDAGDFLLGIDEAIPCGLIVNELVSNCLKHAFPDGRGGEIAIRCRVEEDGWITLKVSDNGVGMSPGLDFSNTETLGLQLVTMLVKQLQGRITIDSEPGGTAVMLSFPGCPSA